MEVIWNKIYTLHPEDSKTNLCVAIPVDRDFWCLEFLCSYTPKILEDREKSRELITEGLKKYVPDKFMDQYSNWENYLPVVNLITLSIDYRDSYLGCAHRHAPEQRHIICKEFASPGFFRHAAAKGPWRAVINIHAVVCDSVAYHLTVRGWDKGEKDFVAL
ncbi:MAG: hypothetical protein LBH73_01305 [Spirochaetaceae bacterium]|jgi:hypothetical protein|nr:hypothetical protein [Spirochaetaceae bacterium]